MLKLLLVAATLALSTAALATPPRSAGVTPAGAAPTRSTGASPTAAPRAPAVTRAAGATANSSSTSGAAAVNAGNQQQITVNLPGQPATQSINQSLITTGTQTIHQSIAGETTQTVRNVPSIGGPALTSSNDTCMGSVSVSGAGVGFGIGLGKTYTDENCVMLKNARELWNMGMRAAAIARMCMDTKVRESLEMTGTQCPQAEREASRASQATYTGDDPIVRQRLGLTN